MILIFKNIFEDNYCIGKITANLSDYNQFLLQKKKIVVNRNYIFSSEKIRNSGNCIYDNVHSFRRILIQCATLDNLLFWIGDWSCYSIISAIISYVQIYKHRIRYLI